MFQETTPVPECLEGWRRSPSVRWRSGWTPTLSSAKTTSSGRRICRSSTPGWWPMGSLQSMTTWMAALAEGPPHRATSALATTMSLKPNPIFLPHPRSSWTEILTCSSAETPRGASGTTSPRTRVAVSSELMMSIRERIKHQFPQAGGLLLKICASTSETSYT